jgi:hypothetical protein
VARLSADARGKNITVSRLVRSILDDYYKSLDDANLASTTHDASSMSPDSQAPATEEEDTRPVIGTEIPF